MLAVGTLLAAPPPEPSFEKVPAPALTALRIAKGKMIPTGLVFVNGRLLPGPYTVTRYGTAIRVNREQVKGDMTKGSPFKLIIKFLIPLLIGNTFQQLYNMADTVIVGNFVNKEALGAVGSTGHVTSCFFI